MSVTIRRAGHRFADREPGRLSHHTFAFGAAYDPEWTAFGPMVCHDDHLLGAGRGFDEHAHSGLEIVTWVVSGAVRHVDSEGNDATLAAGECGVLSAGSGLRHAEHATTDGPARFVQVWLTPDDADRPPHHATATIDAAPGHGLVPVAGAGGPLEVGVAGAAYAVARLDTGEQLTLPAAGRVHAFVATGALRRSSLAEPLQAGDGFFLTEEPGLTVTAGVPSELLVWSLG
ncbi:pirin family protein [Nocardioides panacisoli]|uniref:pirin family protein n=1 Tax=Nocardioides panacisoli TaxID=627624 RepID=UPI001C63251D|nr:pirin family protein [Nocardioides panacisoli]QYJ03437.1 pirin family protein [Nocardioides panacisoli]